MGFFTTLLVLIPLITLPLVFYRITLILDPKRNKPIRHGRRNPNEPSHLLIVLGSGGHTAEMLSMLERCVSEKDPLLRLDWKEFNYRTWVVSTGDTLSAERAKEFEEMAVTLTKQEDLMAGKVRKVTDLGPGQYEIATVPRAREIHQSVYTAPISSVKCALSCYELLTKYTDETREGHGGNGKKDYPDLILTNGPATGTILIYTAILMRFLNTKGCSTRSKLRSVYVESFARVKQLSISGSLLKNVVDRFLVQWPQLKRKAGPRAEYLGVLV